MNMMSEDAVWVWNWVAPTGDGLRRLRQRASERGVWFRRLRREERRYLEAVIGVVDRLRSPLLLRVVGRIVRKLLDAMRGRGGDVAYMMLTVGKPLAERLSWIAQGWGYKSAKRWAMEKDFIRYLTIMHVNTPEPFRGVTL